MDERERQIIIYHPTSKYFMVWDWESRKWKNAKEYAPIKYDYQLKGGKLKVKVIDVGTWEIKAIRNDNGKIDTFPFNYFMKYFKEIVTA